MSASFCKLEFSYQKTDYSLPKFALKDKKATINLQRLFERKKGTLFRVNEEGLLTEIDGWCDWLSYKWNQQQQQALVKKVVDEALSQFNDYLFALQDQKVAQAAACYLFDKRGEQGIGRFSKALYSKTLLKIDNALSKYLLPPNTLRIKIGDHNFLDITDKKLAGKSLPFPLVIDIGDRTLNHNLWMLLKRKVGVNYQVNGEGKFEKVSCSFSYWWDKGAHEARVRAAASAALEHLDRFFSKVEMTEVHQFVLEKIFATDSSLCRMNKRIFDRGVIAEGSFIEKRIAPHLGKKRSEVEEALIGLKNADTEVSKKRAKCHLEKKFLDLTFDEFSFAQSLGIDLEIISEGGTGGARYGFDRHGQRILVIKAFDEGTNNPMVSWLTWFKSFFISIKPCLEGNDEAMAEVDAWLYDRYFEIGNVPTTGIRYVASKAFVGKKYKKCSVQMYVEGCETLGNYIGISSKMQWLPRSFLRWYCGSRFNTGVFYSLGQREDKKRELLNKIPKGVLEHTVVGDGGIENLDCHLDNILVDLQPSSGTESFLDRLFRGDKSILDNEIHGLTEDFFQSKEHQKLLRQFFYTEKITLDGKEKRIALIAIDKGASNPHMHPGVFDYFSTRNTYAFEYLPHCEEPFSDQARALLKGKKETLIQYLCAKGRNNLRNIMQREVFEEFWSIEQNQDLLKKWICTTNGEAEYTHRLNLITACIQAFIKVKKEDYRNLLKRKKQPCDESIIDHLIAQYIKQHGKDVEYYFKYHLNRICGTLQTRIDSFRILKKHVKAKDKMMRTFFKDVKDSSDFLREKRELKDSFDKFMTNWAKKICESALKRELSAKGKEALA